MGSGEDYLRLDKSVLGVAANGGGDEDTIDFWGFGGVTVDLLANTVSGAASARNVVFSNFEHVITSGGDDTIYGTDGANKVYSTNGNDAIYGRGGDDVLDGALGEDRLYGGDGNDMLLMGARNGRDQDYSWGGSGEDCFIVADGVEPAKAQTVDASAAFLKAVPGATKDLIGKTAMAAAFANPAGAFVMALAINGTGNLLVNLLHAKPVAAHSSAKADFVSIGDFNPAEDTLLYRTRSSDIYSATDQSSGDLLLLADQNSQNSGGLLARITFDSGLVSTLAEASGLTNLTVRKQLAEAYQAQLGLIRKVDGHVEVGANQNLTSASDSFVRLDTGAFHDLVSARLNDMASQGQLGLSAGDIDAKVDDYLQLGGHRLASGLTNGEILAVLSGKNGSVQYGGAITAVTNQHTVVLSGTGGSDLLYGGMPVNDNTTANDRAVIFGWGGDDGIVGTRGVDRLKGGAGDDAIVGRDGDDALYGEDGNDILEGGEANDWIEGGDGNDRLAGGAGIDTLKGGAGDDTYYTDSIRDAVVEGAGSGTDRVFAGHSIALLWDNIENVTLTGSGGDNVTGNALNNVITGNSAANSLSGGEGDDTVQGGDGNDFLYGGNGNDTLEGGDGADLLSDDQGNDLLSGGRGNDILYGWLGADRLDGGQGDDVLRGGGGDDTLFGDEGRDVVVGDAGDDAVWGGAGDDTLSGADGDDTVAGGEGNDTLLGGDGVDIMWGESGSDTLSGGFNNDTMAGGAGDDRLTGGNGADVFLFYRDNGGQQFGTDVITDFDADAYGGQDVICLADMSRGLFDTRVHISVANGDTIVAVDGGGVIVLNGVNGVGANAVTIDDFAFGLA